ncbi:hypothetical protein KYJ26_16965 [Bacillus sp. MCCB 382]|nr:hypothetical protein [Bacillus sp. MCCB 382]
METVTIVCYGCSGKGTRVIVDIEDGYGEKVKCDLCNGKGKITEPHPKYF